MDSTPTAGTAADTTVDPAADPRFAGLPGRPGKVIAVHLSYASRAAQRGRAPATPSYFLKPSSSVSAGGVIERPAGTELLAFEGEIALVIGLPARHVPLAEAWRHVAWVTAGDDFGVYDLRAGDRGSNLRSKGGDGFTPLGARLIDARTVDPTALRVRSWVNGTLAQEDSTAGLIFPLAQFVADLSQHLTLETGDVVLTGTPAGSTVVVPGDVVEVEVDAPTAPGAPSSGRLTTTVVQATIPFDPALGALPAVDDTQRAAAFGSRAAAGLPTAPAPDAAPSSASRAAAGLPTAPAPSAPTPSTPPSYGAATRLTPSLRAKLEAAPVATLSAQLRRRGLNDVLIDGVVAVHPERKLVGVAKTLRFLPHREDLFAAHGAGHNPQKQAFDALRDGEVMVIEARGDTGAGTLGDILAQRAKAAGAAGIVTDGAIRDHDGVAAVGIPVFCRGAHPAVLGRRHVAWDYDLTIACGGATVQPGDVIVGDRDGVVVIPAALAEDVADDALMKEAEDDWIAQRVAEGARLDGLFPMDEDWRARYECRLPGVPGGMSETSASPTTPVAPGAPRSDPAADRGRA